MKLSTVGVGFSLVLAILFTCGNTMATSFPSLGDKLPGAGKAEDEMKLKLITKNLKENGYKLLCSQESYRSCYKITEEQCNEEMAKISNECIQSASKGAEDISDRKERAKEMGKLYSACLTANHLALQVASAGSIEKCMKTANIDNSKIMTSLLK